MKILFTFKLGICNISLRFTYWV